MREVPLYLSYQEHPHSKVGRAAFVQFSTKGLTQREILSTLRNYINKTQGPKPVRLLKVRNFWWDPCLSF